MTEHVPHPGLVLIFGAFLLPWLRGTARSVLVIALPLLALWLVWQVGDGAGWQLHFLGHELTPLRGDKLSRLFATIFALVSYQKIGTSAVQSRATGGVANGTYLFALPGSTGACKDAWDEILAPQLDYRHPPCNFVEIFPRLDEHKRRK